MIRVESSPAAADVHSYAKFTERSGKVAVSFAVGGVGVVWRREESGGGRGYVMRR